MIYAFGEYELDTKTFTLHRSGHSVHLRPKVFQVLAYLIAHRDRVVDKQELGEQIWPEVFISDATLESTLRAVRQALGDSGRAQRIIQTLHSRGYRFIAVVTESVEADPDDVARLECAVSASPPALRQDAAVRVPAPAMPVETDDRTRGETWRCSTCQHVNHVYVPGGARFCIECGAPFSIRCPQCGVETPLPAKFCAACGTALTTPSPSASPPQTESEAGTSEDEERRQLTVMFCDLVSSTSLANQLDLEDYRDVLSVYQATCADVIQRFDGHIAQYLGDGLLVYFGYPQAYEDNAQRAVRAGLEMVEALGILNTRLQRELGVQLAVRVGICTGLVIVGVVGSDTHNERLALGNTLNLAAWIQTLAAPNTVVIGAVTAHLVQGYFACEDLGLHTLRGLSIPVHLFRVLRTTGAQSRLDAVDIGGLMPLVGRDAEVALLLERWGQAKEGLGQVVVLSGEAGIGKSRLVRVLKDSLLQTSCVQLESRCSPYYQHSAFYPVMELCQQLFQWQPDETPEVRLGKLEAGLARLELLADDTVHLLANLLSLPDRDNNSSLYPLTPQQRRQKTLEAVLAFVVALASRHPVLLIVEDLHWIDPSTLEFLTLLLDQTATTRLCLVVTCRPTFQAPWGSRSHLTQIMLSRLAHHYIEQIVMGVTGGKALPAEVLRQVIDKTDGVPLFVEECTKTVLEARLLRETADRYELVAPLLAVAIPTTLHDSLLARLDRLGQAKRVAQLGATIGRQFSYALLQAVRQADEANLQQDLGRLIEAELLYQNGLPPRATYMFKHALIQDAAYQSLVRRTRQHYHQRIAQALVAWFPDTVATQPELLAHHYSEAGLNEEAIPYWQQAGQQARLRSANPEAIGHLTQGLALLSRLSDTSEHTQQELNMQMTLGPALIATKGHGAPEVESTYRRAQALCDRLVDAPQRFSVLRGMHTYYVVAGPLETALDLSTQLLHLAQDQMDPAILQAAHLAMGQSLFYLGKLQEAHTHLEAGLAFTDLPQGRTSPYPGAEPGMSCGFYDALVLWLLGFPDQAHARMHQALNRARTLSQPLSLAATLFFAVLLDIWRGDQHTAQVLADEFVTLSATQSFGLYGAYGTILQGWFFVMQGKAEDGLAQMHQGLEALRSTGCQAIRTHSLFLFAEANGVVGQVAAELETLDEALTVVSHYGECFWEPELHRLRGERLLMQDDAEPIVPGDPVEAATSCFQHALALARGQATKSLELRAAMSLSRLWEQQGKAEEARPLLADVYG